MLSAGNKVSLTEIEQFSQVCEDNLPIPNDPVVTENLAKNLEALEQLSPTYQSLIKNFPGILEAKFKEKTDTERKLCGRQFIPVGSRSLHRYGGTVAPGTRTRWPQRFDRFPEKEKC